MDNSLSRKRKQLYHLQAKILGLGNTPVGSFAVELKRLQREIRSQKRANERKCARNNKYQCR